jgi:hypothetical protein
MARIDVEIDVDDMYWDMSRSEKQEMMEKLYEDGYMPKELQEELDGRQPGTNLEQELSDLLDAIYSNKMFLNNDDLETLKHLSKKGL